jgi:hypothetical protein
MTRNLLAVVAAFRLSATSVGVAQTVVPGTAVPAAAPGRPHRGPLRRGRPRRLAAAAQPMRQRRPSRKCRRRRRIAEAMVKADGGALDRLLARS